MGPVPKFKLPSADFWECHTGRRVRSRVALCDMAQRAMRPQRKFTDALKMYVYLRLRIYGSVVPWDVPSHVLEINGTAAKLVPFLKWGTLLPRVRVKPPYLSLLKFPSPRTKFGAQQRMLRRVHGHGLLAWRGVDSTMSTEGIR